MHKKFLIVGALIVSLFAVVTFLKYNSSSNHSPAKTSEKGLAEKEKIRRFWNIYRQATNDRLAGKLELAAAAYENAIALNENHEDALYYFGNMCLELGQYQKAEKAWLRLITVNPQSARAYQQLGNLYLNHKHENIFHIQKAEEAFQKAHEINGEETGPILRLGEVALINSDLNGAKKYFNAVLGSNFKSSEAYFLKGYIAWNSGSRNLAIEMFSKTVEFSQAAKPIKGILGEGDTRPGAKKIQLKHAGPIQSFIANLTFPQHLDISEQIDSHYQKFDAFLTKIRKSITNFSK